MIKTISENKLFGGRQLFCAHESTSTKTNMEFSVYLPPQAETGNCPVLYWLSGLTCTADNFTTKAGAQRYAAEHGIIIVVPDTSPRGTELPTEHDNYDLGSGAGFYLNATQEPWSTNYNMFDYVTDELPALIKLHFPTNDKASISGHSMGGHGALICALKKPGMYQSVSAFAPICAPSSCPWGQKAFTAYLGKDKQSWEEWDSCRLIEQGKVLPPTLIDQGSADQFLIDQLYPNKLQEIGHDQKLSISIRHQEGYDHSYYFIASFVGEHFSWHKKYLT